MKRTRKSLRRNSPLYLFSCLLLAGSGGWLSDTAQAQDNDPADRPDKTQPDTRGVAETPGVVKLLDDKSFEAEENRRGGYQVQETTPTRLDDADRDRYAQGARSEARDRGRDDNRNDSYTIQDDVDSKLGIGKGDQNAGPVRLVRFSYVRGNVTWRRDDGEAWSEASVNLPIRQSAQIWVSEGGRAELQFDDGSLLRLGKGALVTLQTLYSDAEGEFTEIRLSNGLVWMRLKHERSIYQVNTPFASIKAVGPAKIRVGAVDNGEFAVKQGRATVEGKQGKIALDAGDYLNVRDENDPYVLRRLPKRDAWERWNDERDDYLADAERRPSRSYLPDNIAIVAPDLDDYGTWRTDAEYGRVWYPRVTVSNWRPYHYGRWTYVSPFGWTWVSSEPWGWAPYHYGTWCRRSYGWGWVPGPVNQYWSPAVVNFTEYNGNVAWCALAPYEVRYPSSLSIGYHSRRWSAYFSIGAAGVYYPGYDGFCHPRPWTSTYANRVHVTNITNVTNIYNNNPVTVVNTNTYLNRPFIPVNARAGGVLVSSTGAFGGEGTYQALPLGASTTSIFERGRPIGAPAAGSMPVAGPIAARPSAVAYTPSRTYVNDVQLPQGVLARPVVRAPLQPNIARVSSPGSFTGGRGTAIGGVGGGSTVVGGNIGGGRGIDPTTSGSLPPIGSTPVIGAVTGRRGSPVGHLPSTSSETVTGRTLPGRSADDVTGSRSGNRLPGRILDNPGSTSGTAIGAGSVAGSEMRRRGGRTGDPLNSPLNPADEAARNARESLNFPSRIGGSGVVNSNPVTAYPGGIVGGVTGGREPSRGGYQSSPIRRPEVVPNRTDSYRTDPFGNAGAGRIESPGRSNFPGRSNSQPITTLPSGSPTIPPMPDAVRRARQDPIFNAPSSPFPSGSTGSVTQPAPVRDNPAYRVPNTPDRSLPPWRDPNQWQRPSVSREAPRMEAPRMDAPRSNPSASNLPPWRTVPNRSGGIESPRQPQWQVAPQRAPEVYRVPDSRSAPSGIRSAPPVVSRPTPAQAQPAPANSSSSTSGESTASGRRRR